MSDSHTLEHEIVAALRQIIQEVDLHSRRLLEEHGLTGPQLATLQEAARMGPVSSGALARAVHLSQPTITGILGRLEQRGLVSRSRSETDRRTVDVTVTEAAHEVLGRAPSLLQDRFRRQLSDLEEWERLQILAILKRIAAMMRADGQTAPADAWADAPEGLLAPLFDQRAAATEDRRPAPQTTENNPEVNQA